MKKTKTNNENLLKVTNILRQLGIPAGIKGYAYLREAICLSLEDNDMLENVTTQLYPTVAEKFDTLPSRAARAIQHAIEVSWANGGREKMNKIFNFDFDSRPSNIIFIAFVVDNIKLNYNTTDET